MVKEIGAKAIILNNKGNVHSFPKGTEVKFLGMNRGWYMFENEKNGIKQGIAEEHFKWFNE